MKMSWARRQQFAAACVLIAAYAGFSHLLNSSGSAHDWGTVMALAPLIVVLTIAVGRTIRPLVAVLLRAALAVLVFEVWPLLTLHYSLLNLVQETTVYGLLGATFGRTLLAGRAAVCTQLADKVHGPLSPREVWYTRRVTAAWVIFFFAVTIVSLLHFTLAPLRIWSAYINFCVLPVGVVMFLAEHLVVRRRILPQLKGAGLLATVRVYLATTQ